MSFVVEENIDNEIVHAAIAEENEDDSTDIEDLACFVKEIQDEVFHTTAERHANNSFLHGIGSYINHRTGWKNFASNFQECSREQNTNFEKCFKGL